MPKTGHEGSGCHPDIGAPRIRMRPPPREPLRLSEPRRRPGAGRWCREGWRRSGEGRPGGDPAPERSSPQPLSLMEGGRPGLQGEPPDTSDPGPQRRHPSQERELRLHRPGRPAGQQISPVVGRRLGGLFQIQLDAGLQGRLDFVEGGPGDGDVQVNAERLPRLPDPEGVAPYAQRPRIPAAASLFSHLHRSWRVPRGAAPRPIRGGLASGAV